MDALSGSALIFSVLIGAMMVGGLLSYLGILPQVGYLLTGYFVMPALPTSIQNFLLASAVPLLLFYLGYVASSRRIFRAPLQTVFIQPMRVAVGFAMFFVLFYVAGVPVAQSIGFALLFSTSSALILRWGFHFAYRQVEEALVALDAAVSALVLLHMLDVPGWGVLLAAVFYVAYFFTESVWEDTVIAVVATVLWYIHVLNPLALLFILGAYTHHRLHGARKHWADPFVHDAIPLYFLFALAGAVQSPVTLPTILIFIGILVISFIQNFIALVVLGPLFGIPPKTGAHMTARAFGPSEAAVAAAILSGYGNIALAALMFYALSLFVYSFVRTDAEAERFVSTLLPASVSRMLERLEAGYAPIYVKMRALIGSEFVRHAYRQARRIIASLVILIAAALVLLDAVTVPAQHTVLIALVAITIMLGSVWLAVPAYMDMYCDAIMFLSKYAYERPLRPGQAPRYFTGGYLAVLAGFVLLPLTIPSANLVIIFFALLFLNLGLYVLVNNYYRIVSELVARANA